MSLVKLSNKESHVEMNNLEYLTWTDGWNGGTWNNWDVINKPTEYDFYLVTSEKILSVDVAVRDIHGTDSDMGHTYHYKSPRFFVKVNSDVGLTDVRSDLLPKGFSLMYTEKGD